MTTSQIETLPPLTGLNLNAPVIEPKLSAWKPLAVLLAFAIVGSVLPSLIGSPTALTLLTQATIGAILATSVGFLIRQNGLVSFGHAVFYGMAGYLIALSLARNVASAEVSILGALVLPTLMAFVLGLIFVRMVGVAFSMLTLAVAQGFYEVFARWRELANGEDGLRVDFPSKIFGIDLTVFQHAESMFVVCWLLLMVVLLALWMLTKSHFGTLTLAIRENEERARFIGYGTTLPRAIIYAISAFIACMSGVLFALYNGFVTPDVLHWSLSGEFMIMAIIGGTRSVWGPALGAMFFFFLKGAVGDVTEHWQAILGVLLIIVVIMAPGGISGMLVALKNRVFGGKAA